MEWLIGRTPLLRNVVTVEEEGVAMLQIKIGLHVVFVQYGRTGRRDRDKETLSVIRTYAAPHERIIKDQTDGCTENRLDNIHTRRRGHE
jgi:hypothetical protein